MIETSTVIDDVKGEFEGGTSLSVNWDTLIRRAVEIVIDNCRPETLKRRVPIYGGLAINLSAYYCPADVLVPSDLYTNDGTRKFTYQPPKTFYTRGENNKYTIEYVNGARFLVVRHEVAQTSLTVEAFDEVGTITGGTPTLDEHNFLSGSGAVRASFTDAGVEFGDSITAIDITEYLRGIALFSAYLPTASKLASLQLRLKTSDTDYYRALTTSDSIGDYLVDGWNQVRFDLANAVAVGSPVLTNINEWSIIGTTDSGETMTITFDRFTLQKSAPYYLQYYSKYAYISGTSGAFWQPTVSFGVNDKINFDRDVAAILHFELCLLVTQAGTFDRIDSQSTKRFEGQLKRAYQNYWAIHPSDEAPLSYSISPDIAMSDDIDFGVADRSELLDENGL